jgi:hypothetical protein
MRSPRKAIQFIELSHEEDGAVHSKSQETSVILLQCMKVRFGRNLVVTVLRTCGGSSLFHILLLL